VIDQAIAEENRWRAQRYGTAASFVVRGRSSVEPIKASVDGLLALLDEDAKTLDCENEVLGTGALLGRGSSADAQLEVYRAARSAGRSRKQALAEVIDWVRRTTAEP
jgi:carboxylate-amine ligase